MTTTLNVTNSLEQTIVDAIAEARETCDINGINSPGCAVAWDIVEELQAEKADQQRAKQQQSSLENYCDNHPESVECLIYDV